MPIYMINFELRNQSKNHDYTPFTEELKNQKCHPLLQNCFLGSFNNNATQVHTHFKKLIDKDDRLMVMELTKHFAYSNAMANCNKWLELNPPADLRGALNQNAVKAEAKKAPAKKAAPKKPSIEAENPDKPKAASKKKK